MKNKNSLFSKYLFLFVVGGLIYMLIEFVWRQHTHWSMGLLGGICFIELGLINEILPWNMSLIKQILIGTIIVTINEFIAGLILNVWLKWDIWDYSHLPLNIMGQVCIPYCFLWTFVVAFGIFVDDYVRYKYFGEELPRYRIGKKVFYPIKK